jgi:hypothetical protein
VLTIVVKAPRRIPAVLARVKEADPIARRITQVGFTPKPWLILGSGLELKAGNRQLLNFGVNVLELEIDNDAIRVRHGGCSVERERGVADRALEPRVVRRIADDQTQAEPSIEGDGGIEVDAGHRYLVEVHKKRLLDGWAPLIDKSRECNERRLRPMPFLVGKE